MAGKQATVRSALNREPVVVGPTWAFSRVRSRENLEKYAIFGKVWPPEITLINSRRTVMVCVRVVYINAVRDPLDSVTNERCSMIIYIF